MTCETTMETMKTENETMNASERRALREMDELIDARRTLILATMDSEGAPEASYAPFCRANGDGFLIYVSEIAKHARNLMATGRASVLWIEDEADADQTYAHRRLTFPCRAVEIERGTDDFVVGMARLRDRHGDIIDNIGRMEDFHLFRLRPEGLGRLVLGFGRAYDIEGPGMDRIRHLNGAGATGGHRIAHR